jgi:hypothetical protein
VRRAPTDTATAARHPAVLIGEIRANPRPVIS